MFMSLLAMPSLENIARSNNEPSDRPLNWAHEPNEHEPFLMAEHKGHDKLAASGRVHGATICFGPVNLPETDAQPVGGTTLLSMLLR